MTTTSSTSGHRGAVRNPKSDGRLKHNREAGVSKMTGSRTNVQHGGQGRVKDPTQDKRLKNNR